MVNTYTVLEIQSQTNLFFSLLSVILSQALLFLHVFLHIFGVSSVLKVCFSIHVLEHSHFITKRETRNES